MKTSLTISIDTDVAEQVQEMKKRGIKPSFLFSQIMKAFAANDFKYPIKYNGDSII